MFNFKRPSEQFAQCKDNFIRIDSTVCDVTDVWSEIL